MHPASPSHWGRSHYAQRWHTLRSIPFVMISACWWTAATLAVTGGIAEGSDVPWVRYGLMLVVVAVGSFLVWRSLRQSVVADPSRLAYFQLLRTVRVEWSDVTQIDVEDYSGWLNRGERSSIFKMPVVITATGRRIELQCLIGRTATVNERVRTLREIRSRFSLGCGAEPGAN